MITRMVRSVAVNGAISSNVIEHWKKMPSEFSFQFAFCELWTSAFPYLAFRKNKVGLVSFIPVLTTICYYSIGFTNSHCSSDFDDRTFWEKIQSNMGCITYTTYVVQATKQTNEINYFELNYELVVRDVLDLLSNFKFIFLCQPYMMKSHLVGNCSRWSPNMSPIQVIDGKRCEVAMLNDCGDNAEEMDPGKVGGRTFWEKAKECPGVACAFCSKCQFLSRIVHWYFYRSANLGEARKELLEANPCGHELLFSH